MTKGLGWILVALLSLFAWFAVSASAGHPKARVAVAQATIMVRSARPVLPNDFGRSGAIEGTPGYVIESQPKPSPAAGRRVGLISVARGCPPCKTAKAVADELKAAGWDVGNWSDKTGHAVHIHERGSLDDLATDSLANRYAVNPQTGIIETPVWVLFHPDNTFSQIRGPSSATVISAFLEGR